MPVVQIEHPIRDFETWKAAFDRDPVQREASGVTSYRIYRPVDDPRTTSPWTSSSRPGPGGGLRAGAPGAVAFPAGRAGPRRHAAGAHRRHGREPGLLTRAARPSAAGVLALRLGDLPPVRLSRAQGVRHPGHRRAGPVLPSRLPGSPARLAFGHPGRDLDLVALVVRHVVAAVLQLVGQVLLSDVVALEVVAGTR